MPPMTPVISTGTSRMERQSNRPSSRQEPCRIRPPPTLRAASSPAPGSHPILLLGGGRQAGKRARNPTISDPQASDDGASLRAAATRILRPAVFPGEGLHRFVHTEQGLLSHSEHLHLATGHRKR